jgi:hypothetical protein
VGAAGLRREREFGWIHGLTHDFLRVRRVGSALDTTAQRFKFICRSRTRTG